jgi:hypothetical protein
MFKKLLIFIPLALSVGAMHVHAGTLPIPALPAFNESQREILAERSMSLTNRHAVPSVNDVFADNILLTLSYLSGRVSDKTLVNWDEVRKPQQHEIVLKPGEVFAFHDGVISEFSENVVTTTNAHFNASDGFLSSGYLYGDGVCHLASLLNQAAKDANLKVVAPVNHDFALIPDMPREFGTAIYYSPNEHSVSEQQNLYIQNTLDKPISIVIESQEKNVNVRVEMSK